VAFLEPNPAPNWQAIAAAIHASRRLMVIAVTGGGSGALSTLLQTPGASKTILEATVPYSLASLVDWIGGKPDQACSEATALAMAMAAFVRARELAPDADSALLLGIGATASLATDRPKRGERRIHVGLQSAQYSSVHSYSLVNVPPTRADDERVATSFLLWAIAGGCQVDAAPLKDSLPTGRRDELLDWNGEKAWPEQTELLLGLRRRAVLRPNSSVNYFEEPPPPTPVVFPGAFNPPHTGHLRMATIAEQRFHQPAAWELSITNVDKPPLDFISIRDRVHALRFEDGNRLIALTRAATFREKAEIFPGATFIVGVDTLLRIAEPRYYGDDAARRDGAIAEIARRGCRFLVFGRDVEGRFMTLGDLNLPVELRRLCDEVPATEFREDVSSTALRQPPSG
jgi:hypothetical protein